MQKIPVLNIEEFEQAVPLTNVYSNNLKTHLHNNRNLFYKPHSHNFYLCVLFTEGVGLHDIDFNSYEVKRGSVFFLKPGQIHFWKFTKPINGYIFFHTRDFYELHFSKSKPEGFPFFNSIENIPYLTLAEKDIAHIQHYFEHINTEYHQNLPYQKQKLASLFNTLYIDLSRLYNNQIPHTPQTSITYINLLQHAEKLIELHYKTEKNAGFYANKLNITTKHLNRVTKTILNKTITNTITDRVVLEAKRQLVHGNNSLVAIATNLGYNDYAYFSRLFKNKTGMSPLKFKQKYTL